MRQGLSMGMAAENPEHRTGCRLEVPRTSSRREHSIMHRIRVPEPCVDACRCPSCKRLAGSAQDGARPRAGKRDVGHHALDTDHHVCKPPMSWSR